MPAYQLVASVAHDTYAGLSMRVACDERRVFSYACELKTYPPAPFAIAMPKFTYNPILVMRTPGSLLLELVRYVLSW